MLKLLRIMVLAFFSFSLIFSLDHSEFVRSIKTGRDVSRSEAVIFTAGAYDLFHIGHLKLLEGARALGGRLIVGVASDDFMTQVKKRKPVINEQQRLAIIKSLKCVDEAYINNSLDELRLFIKDSGADVVVKGSDWEGLFDDLAGCSVTYLPYTEGISTTKIIETIGERSGVSYVVVPGKETMALTLYQLMYDFDFYCSEYGLAYVATAGTALGAIRHGGLMQWDDDLDVMILKNQLAGLNKVIAAMKSLGYVIEDRRNSKDYPWDGFKIKAMQSSGKSWDLDVFVHDLESDRTPLDLIAHVFKGSKIFPLRRIRFGAFFINLDNDFQNQCDNNFGKDWLHKVKKYNHSENLSGEVQILQQGDFLPLGPVGPLKARQAQIAVVSAASKSILPSENYEEKYSKKYWLSKALLQKGYYPWGKSGTTP